jgi:flavin reductase (DIM6/NTAB) family NADH-FMN oxidoreductase RutF
MAVNFTENLGEAMENLYKKGAFLTVKDGEKVNTMTISWGNIGFEWKKPIFTALVRKSRYTHEFMENAGEFTISIPSDKNLQQALAFCGTKSGRDVNKFEKCNLEITAGENVNTPVIANCGYIYECKVVYKQDMDLSLLSEEVVKASYPDDDDHTIYYGEIVACYKNK